MAGPLGCARALLPLVEAPGARAVFTGADAQGRSLGPSAELEALLARQALERTGGNKSGAARLLGLTRANLLDRLEKLGQPADDDACGVRASR